MAEPGTAILVREGTYVENVTISAGVNPNLKNLSAGEPLAIVSVDGPGAAKIVGADQSGLVSTVFTVGMSHLRIDGFEIVGNVSRERGANDGGPLKIIGNADVAKPSTDVVIENNTFSGTGISLLKVTKTKDALIVNNSFEGQVHQNFIDMVTVWDSKVASNDFVGEAWLGITMKTGSHNITVEHNFFGFENHSGRATQTAVLVGGVGYSQLQREPLPEGFHFEASDIRVLENLIVGASDYGVMFQGGIDSTASGNVIANAGGVAFKSTVSPSPHPHGGASAGNTISDNVLVGIDRLHETYGTTAGYTIVGNSAGTLADIGFDYGRGSGGEPQNAPPVLEMASALAVDEGTRIELAVAASDPDGPVPSLSVALVRGADGSVVDPSRHSFTVGADGRGVFAWEPGEADDGDYRVVVTASDGATTVTGIASLTVHEVNRAPELAVPADVVVDEGCMAAFTVSSVDGDGQVPALSLVLIHKASGAVVDPALYRFVDNGDGTGNFVWRTGEKHDGSYRAVVVADDGALRTSETVDLTVHEVPVAMTIRAGGVGTAAAPPEFEVFADGASLGVHKIASPSRGGFDAKDDRMFEDFRFELAGGSPDVIEIVFRNDGKSGGVNRDLVVDWVSIDGRVHESEVDGYFTQANGRATFEGAREFLYVDGTLTFEGLAGSDMV